jgi:hypothetical protein
MVQFFLLGFRKQKKKNRTSKADWNEI